MKHARTSAVLSLFVLAIAGFPAENVRPAPELTAGLWIRNPVSLKDVRGNVVLLAFWDTSIHTMARVSHRFVGPDYLAYRLKPNVTFVGICCTPGAGLAELQADCAKLKIADLPFPKMTDLDGATAKAYGVKFGISNFALVVVDHSGNIAFNDDAGLCWSGKTAKGDVYLRHQAADKCVKVAPGLFGGLTPPPGLSDAVHYFNLQQFGLVNREVAQFRQTPGSDKKEDQKPAALLTPENPGNEDKIIELMEPRLAIYRKARIGELTELAEKDPFRAYQESQAFVQDTMGFGEHTAAQALVKKLTGMPEVRKKIAEENAKAKLETEAKTSFEKVVSPRLYQTKNLSQYRQSFEPIWNAYLQRYGETVFAREAQTIVAKKKAVLR